MQRRISRIRETAIAFAHRGAKAHAQENTLDAFLLAMKLGANGLESDVWITQDGIAVLDHDGIAQRFPKRKINQANQDELPSHIPTLSQLFEISNGLDISLDVKDAEAIHAVVQCATNDKYPPSQMWLCHPNNELLASWKVKYPQFNFVHSTFLGKITTTFESHIAKLSESGIAALNLHHSEWTGGLVSLVHRFELNAFGWDAQYERVLENLFAMGIDGVYSDWVDRLMDAHVRHH